MGFFGSGESADQIKEKIRNGEAGIAFANAICNMFSPGGNGYQWLMQNSKERHVQLSVSKSGVMLVFVEVNQYRYKQTGTYDVDKKGFGFGASGYQDLPNSKYVNAFTLYLVEQLRTRCSGITCNNYSGWIIKLEESAKKGW